MRSKLLYCLTLVAVIFTLSVTLLKREEKSSGILNANKLESASEKVSGSTTEFMFVESLTKFLVLNLNR